MLKRLSISNYALIDQLEIDFEQGLTIITGETGAGKSIILGALSLILGERADSSSIRDRERKTVVEACFDIEDYSLEAFFRDNELDYYDGELIARREINPNGRSRAFINDGVVGLATLKELMTRLVDIHSQHSNMLLSRPAFQLSILDNIAGHDEELCSYYDIYNVYKATERQLKDLRDNDERNRSEEEYLRFQLNQLQEINLKPSEDEELEQQQRRLANASSLKEDMWKVMSILDGEENSLLEQLKDVHNTLAVAEEDLEEVAGMSERVNNALIDLKDIVQSVGAVEESLNDDPATLQQVEERLNTIYSLERKHNVKSVDELLKLQEVYEHRLAAIDSSEERIAELQTLLDEQHDQALKQARVISENRKKAAGKFAASLQKEDLMACAQADVAFHEIISAATENRRLIQILNNIREQIYRYRLENLKDKSSHANLVEEHTAICRALEERSEEKASEAVRVHIEHQKISIMESLHMNTI